MGDVGEKRVGKIMIAQEEEAEKGDIYLQSGKYLEAFDDSIPPPEISSSF